MYFIELILKKLIQKKNKTIYYNPDSRDEFQNYEGCEHIFMPIDSTNEILSCTKCGVLVKWSELKNKNFFVQDL